MENNRSTLGRDAYHAIKTAIREGIYRPGERLREDEVAKRFGISRTPVREALARLQDKGLIEAGSGRGLSVTVLDMQQIFELYALREEMEGVVARFAAQHATQVEIENLTQLNESFSRATEPLEASRLNRLFHDRLHDAARNRYLQVAVEELHDSIALLPTTTFHKEGRVADATAEHETIIDAIRRRDADTAWKASREHISNALKTRLSLMQAT
ncbi:MAG TPA: GntR family transcriptional regulator [Devosia sp.]|nr:GntR family transcriptional regulator [Devosia sp.]